MVGIVAKSARLRIIKRTTIRFLEASMEDYGVAHNCAYNLSVWNRLYNAINCQAQGAPLVAKSHLAIFSAVIRLDSGFSLSVDKSCFNSWIEAASTMSIEDQIRGWLILLSIELSVNVSKESGQNFPVTTRETSLILEIIAITWGVDFELYKQTIKTVFQDPKSNEVLHDSIDRLVLDNIGQSNARFYAA